MKVYLLSFSCLLLIASAQAEPMRGPLPAKQQELIRFMAVHHTEIHRVVELTEHGYRARTTSENPEVAAALIDHFRYMKQRMDSGGRVRNWDPAFREMAVFHDRMETKLHELPNGLEVEVTGKDAEATLVARNHARVVSGFAAEGRAAVERKHATALITEPGDVDRPSQRNLRTKEDPDPGQPPD